MKTEISYGKAHLFIAAIRVLEHLHKRPPALKDISDLLLISLDESSRISRRLEELEIIKCIKSGIDERFGLQDHTKIETLPREETAPGMLDEVMRLKQQKQSKLEELEQFMKKGPGKPDIFQELDKALKDPSLLKKKNNPLD